MKINQYISECLISVINSYNSFTTIFDCANSHYSKGTVCYKCTPSNKHTHQFRLKNESLKKFALQVEKELQPWNGIESFEDLFEKIKAIAKNIRNNSKDKETLGELLIYDCAARIAYLRYMSNEGDCRPKEQVYIHAGVYEGAMWLYNNGYIAKKPRRNTALHINDFSESTFKKLFEVLDKKQYKGLTKSMILESFMCCMLNVDKLSFCKRCRLQNKEKN